MHKRLHKCFVALILVVLCFQLATSALGEEKSKKSPAQAIIAGGVYDEAGYALRGIRVKIWREKERKPKWEAISDARGEFAVRVPAGRATYLVSTHSKEHLNQEQQVEIYGHERVELVFRLPARPRKDSDNGR